MDKKAKIFVAGHRGLVGSAIMRKLLAEGYENLITRTSKELDLRNQAMVNDFFATERPEYVFMAAARVGGIYANNAFPAEFIRDNIQIQTNTIDAAYGNGVKKLLFLGSSCIYPKLAPQPLQEEYLLSGPLEPTNQWYAIAKIAGIKMCQAYRRQYGFNAIAAMPTNLYGPNDNYDLQTSHVLPAMIRKFHLGKLATLGDTAAIARDEAMHGRIPDDILQMLGLLRKEGGFSRNGDAVKVVIWGTGSPRREFLHSDDLADALLYLMRNYDEEQFVNVGVGEDATIRDLAELLRQIVGFEGAVRWDESKPDGTPRKLMDVSRLRMHGWQAKISLEGGLRHVYKSYVSRGLLG